MTEPELELRTDGERQAQQLHEQRQAQDSDHDPGCCWCCCQDCNFDWKTVTGAVK